MVSSVLIRGEVLRDKPTALPPQNRFCMPFESLGAEGANVGALNLPQDATVTLVLRVAGIDCLHNETGIFTGGCGS